MAKIQIDFDQVMRFGALHGQIGRSIDAQRSVFRGDSNHLDQVMAAFGLTRSPGGTTFQGMSVAGAMGDADARAGRVANTLAMSSTRIFNYAGANQALDSHFNWAGNAAQAFWGPMTGPFGSHLAGMLGGKLAGTVATGVLFTGMTPGMILLFPVFAGVAGVLNLIHGVTDIQHAGSDSWLMSAGGLRIGAGVLGLGVAIGVGAAILSAGAAVGAGLTLATVFAVGATVAVTAAPVLVVAGLLSLAALGIENRDQMGQIAADAAKGIGGVVKALETTATETAHDLLAGATNIWNKTVQLATSTITGIRDVAFSSVEEVHNALTNVERNLARPLHLTPTDSAAVASTIPVAPAILPTQVERVEIWSFDVSAGVGKFVQGKGKMVYRLEFLSDDRVRVVALSGIGGGVGVGGAVGAKVDVGDSEVGLHADVSAEANAMFLGGNTREFTSEAAAVRYFQSELAKQALLRSWGIVGGPVAIGVVGEVAAQFVEQGRPYSTSVGIGEDGSATAKLQNGVWPGGASVSFDQAHGVQQYADGSVGYVYTLDASGKAGIIGVDGSAAGGGQYEVRVGPDSAVLHVQALTEVNGSRRLTETSVDLTGAPQAILDAVTRGDLASVQNYLSQHGESRVTDYSLGDQGITIDGLVAGASGTKVVMIARDGGGGGGRGW